MLVCNKCRRIAATETSTMKSIDGVLLCARCADIHANPPLPLAVYIARATMAIASGAVAAFVSFGTIALLAIGFALSPVGWPAIEALIGSGYSGIFTLPLLIIACAALALALATFCFYLGAYVISQLWPDTKERKGSPEKRNA